MGMHGEGRGKEEFQRLTVFSSCHSFLLLRGLLFVDCFETASRRLGKLTDIINCTPQDYTRASGEEVLR